jgi:lipopolysaccharide transport system permease protein
MSAAVPAVAAADSTEVVIRPPERWSGFGIRDVWQYRELLYFLTKRDIQIRYKQSFFGILWAIAQPLFYVLIFTFVFSRGANVQSEPGVPYPVLALAAMVPWLFFQQSVNGISSGLVGEANLLTKVYFPRLVLPIARSVSFLVDLALAFVILAVFVAVTGVTPSWAILLVPFFILLAFVAAIGVGIFFGALNVKYRDVSVVVPLIVSLWLFATPVIYPASVISPHMQTYLSVNPMFNVINGIRWGWCSTPAPPLLNVAISAAAALVFLVAGLFYFRRTERFFADVV